MMVKVMIYVSIMEYLVSGETSNQEGLLLFSQNMISGSNQRKRELLEDVWGSGHYQREGKGQKLQEARFYPTS